MTISTMPFYVFVGYVVGFFVFPFCLSFVGGWPFLDRKADMFDFGFTFGASLFWPVVVVVWLVSVWWCGLSWLGAEARKLVSR